MKAAAAVALALGLASGAQAAETEQAILALPGTNLLFLGQYIAADLHLWEKQGLTVKLINITGIGAMNAVIAGSAEFSISSGPSLTRATARGQKLVALATTVDQSGQDVVLRKDVADALHFDPAAPLKARAALLKGRIVAISATAAIPDVVLRVVALEGGVAPDQLTIPPMQPPEFMAAFARHEIDGFSNSPPFIQQVVANGTGVVLSDTAKGEPTQYAPMSSSVLVARADYCAGHASICAKIVHGLVEAAALAHKDPAAALGVTKARFANYSDAVLAESVKMVTAIMPTPPLTTVQELRNGDLMNAAAGFVKKSELLDRYEPLIDNAYVK